VYYEQTHPEFTAQARRPVLHLNTGDAKDHPGYGSVKAQLNGDAKDHPGYSSVQEQSFQAQLAELAELEGLTGLSPAFLQPVGQPRVPVVIRF
jgi:hypothetical protein